MNFFLLRVFALCSAVLALPFTIFLEGKIAPFSDGDFAIGSRPLFLAESALKNRVGGPQRRKISFFERTAGLSKAALDTL